MKLHDGPARGLVPSRAAARGRAHRRLRGPLLLACPAPSRWRGRVACRATRGATTTPCCASSSTRSGGGSAARYRVLVDANQHVDREGAARAGVGFYGKNTLLITRDARLLGRARDARHRRRDRGRRRRSTSTAARCRLCIDACPTGALDEPGVLDATKCLSYWTQAPASVPEAYRTELGGQVYGCDICQDVCPWNRGVEKRRRRAPLPESAVPNVSLADWLTARRRRARRQSSTGSTSRATTRAGCDATRCSPSATPARRRTTAVAAPLRRRRRRDARRDRRLGLQRLEQRERMTTATYAARRAGARAAEPGRRARGDRRGAQRLEGGPARRRAAAAARACGGRRAGTSNGCSLDAGLVRPIREARPLAVERPPRRRSDAHGRWSRPGSSSTAIPAGCGRRSTT